MQIAKGLVVDGHRRRQIEQAYLEALASRPEAYAPSPEERTIALNALLRICAVLDGLPPKVRETFLLSRFEGLTYSQRVGRARGHQPARQRDDWTPGRLVPL